VANEPRLRLRIECARRGQPAFAKACAELLVGGRGDDELIFALGGPAARSVLFEDHRVNQLYWLRVWAAWGLLWEWDGVALPALVKSFGDDEWRVREMAAKVVARHEIGDALDLVAALRADGVPRVRVAATRAVAAIPAAGA
jgi:hypothetical protein